MDSNHKNAPPPSAEITWSVLDRYLAGDASLGDVAQVERWMAQDPNNAAFLTAVRDPEARGSIRKARDVDGQWWEFVSRDARRLGMKSPMSSNEAKIPQWGFSSRRRMAPRAEFTDQRGRRIIGWERQILRRWAWPAGFIAFAAFVAVFVWHPHGQDFGTSRSYTTAIGQRATLVLDDSTRVMMAPKTTVRLVRFGRRSRTIVLDGDAYFDVAPSARVPFVVHAGTETIRVLGTAFEVRHDPRVEQLQVAVATGKVLVSSNAWHSATLVTAGHVLSVTDSIRTVKAVENINTEIGWLGDQLVFQEAPITKVLETLNRWYGYRFRYTDSAVARQSVTIGLSMKSSTEALATLEKILDVHLTIVGDTVTLTPVHVRTTPRPRAKQYDIWLPTREVGR